MLLEPRHIDRLHRRGILRSDRPCMLTHFPLRAFVILRIGVSSSWSIPRNISMFTARTWIICQILSQCTDPKWFGSIACCRQKVSCIFRRSFFLSKFFLRFDRITYFMAFRRFLSTSAVIYGFMIFFQFVSSVIILAGVIFHIDRVNLRFISSSFLFFPMSQWVLLIQTCHHQRLNDFNADAGYLLIVLAARMAYLFFYCYFGKSSTDSYWKISDALYESNWKELPVNLQRYFILMIGNATKPLQYDAFGIAPLNLQTYTNVCSELISKKRIRRTSVYLNKLMNSTSQILKTVCSYYMMFRTITSDWTHIKWNYFQQNT